MNTAIHPCVVERETERELGLELENLFFSFLYRERDYRTYKCGRERVIVELLYVTGRVGLSKLQMWQGQDDFRTCMCVRQTENVKLPSVTENLIMCVAEGMRPQYTDLWQREVSKLVSYAKSTITLISGRGREKETAELRYVAERGRLQNLYMWQRE